MGLSFICPNCQKPVYPGSPDAVMSAGSKAWFHKECCDSAFPPIQTSEYKGPERRQRPRA